MVGRRLLMRRKTPNGMEHQQFRAKVRQYDQTLNSHCRHAMKKKFMINGTSIACAVLMVLMATPIAAMIRR